MDSLDYIASDTEEYVFVELPVQPDTAKDKHRLPFPGVHSEDIYDLIPEDEYEKGSWRTTHESFNPEIKKGLGIEHVIKEVGLAFLPAKSLCRFKSVCKGWNQWIKQPFFIHRQSYYFQEFSGFFYQRPGLMPSFISRDSCAYGVPCPALEFLPEQVILRASCHGLICCQSSFGDNQYYICNPVNRQWLMLPPPKLYHGPESVVVLAHGPSVLDFAANYELICAVPMMDKSFVCFEIFSSRSRTWRVVDTVCCDLNGSKFLGDGIYMKDFAYWQTLSGEVLAFDIRYEEYSIFPLPTSTGPQGVLTESHGELCYILPHKVGDKACMIEVYGGMNMSLRHTISFHIGEFIDNGGLSSQNLTSQNRFLRALPCLSNDLFVVVIGKRLMAYDVRAQKAELLHVESNLDGAVKFLPYVNSLIPVRHHQLFSEIRDVMTGSSSSSSPLAGPI